MVVETLAEQVAGQLRRQNKFLVLAESCTGGMVASMLTGVPGISQHFCGSAVVYRETTKQHWLHVAAATLEQYSAESPETTRELARQVLAQTPEAHVAAAITGHLGPDAPIHDGAVYCCVAQRGIRAVTDSDLAHESSLDFQLVSRSRIERQVEAARTLLSFLNQTLADNP